MSRKGVYMVAYGETAEHHAKHAVDSVRQWAKLPVKVANGYHRSDPDLDDNKQASRWAKVTMLQRIPTDWDSVLYLDADTRVQADPNHIFGILDDGWDIAMRASDHQGREAFWHVNSDEREATLEKWGCEPLQLQCGVMFVAKNARTLALFDAWVDEWLKWLDEDQAAFSRALQRVPVRIWLLGYPWNGGALIKHKFGSCRQ